MTLRNFQTWYQQSVVFFCRVLPLFHSVYFTRVGSGRIGSQVSYLTRFHLCAEHCVGAIGLAAMHAAYVGRIHRIHGRQQ